MSVIAGVSNFDLVSGSISLYNFWDNFFNEPAVVEKTIHKHIFGGVVEDNLDPLKRGRMKVRVYDVHGDSDVLSTDDLPWAHVMSPTTSPGLSGIGCNPYILNGTNVLLLPVDTELQRWLVVGTLPTFTYGEGFDVGKGFCDITGQYPYKNNKNDLPEEALGKLKEFDKPFINKPPSCAKPEYPYNHVYKTESGHSQEFDDTPGSERIDIRHKSGTGTEYQTNGSKIVEVKGSNYTCVLQDDTVEVHGTMHISASTGANISITGDADINVTGNLRVNTTESAFIDIDGILNVQSGNQISINSLQDVLVRSEKNIVMQTQPKGSCKRPDGSLIGKEEGNLAWNNAMICEYGVNVNQKTGEGAVATGNVWVADNTANIIMQAWDDIYMSAKHGQVYIDANKNISNVSHSGNVKLETVAPTGDINMLAGDDINLKAGTTDNFCTNPEYTSKHECELNGACYINGIKQDQITDMITCISTDVPFLPGEFGTWERNKWITNSDGNISMEGENINMVAFEKNGDGVIGPDAATTEHIDHRTKLDMSKNQVLIDGKEIHLNKDR